MPLTLHRYVCVKSFQIPLYIPLYGCSVSAGFPSPADDYIEGHLDLNRHLIKNPAATFFVRADGHSMIGAGIHDGDILIVDRSLNPAEGSIVVVAVDGEMTVKRISRRNGRTYLEPENTAYPPIELTDGCNVWVWGVVVHVVHTVS